MSENAEKSWGERSGRKITDTEFASILQAARELPGLLSAAYLQLDTIYEQDNKPDVKLAQDFVALRETGASRSQDDAFRALEGLTKENVTVAKDEWFRKVAQLYRRTANALAKRELDDTRPWSAEDKQRAPEAARTLMERILSNAQAMEKVYPPSRGAEKK